MALNKKPVLFIRTGQHGNEDVGMGVGEVDLNVVPGSRRHHVGDDPDSKLKAIFIKKFSV